MYDPTCLRARCADHLAKWQAPEPSGKGGVCSRPMSVGGLERVGGGVCGSSAGMSLDAHVIASLMASEVSRHGPQTVGRDGGDEFWTNVGMVERSMSSSMAEGQAFKQFW
jgi:hypothetical protein